MDFYHFIDKQFPLTLNNPLTLPPNINLTILKKI